MSYIPLSALTPSRALSCVEREIGTDQGIKAV